MKLFGMGGTTPPALGAAMLALVGQAAITTEQAQAANTELDATGIKGAQLITQAAYSDLSEKAGRVDAAEKTATDEKARADKATTDLATEKARADKATTDLATANTELERLRKLPGASHSTPTLEAGKSDVEGEQPDEHQQAIGNLGHNKALDNHPLFSGLGRKQG